MKYAGLLCIIGFFLCTPTAKAVCYDIYEEESQETDEGVAVILTYIGTVCYSDGGGGGGGGGGEEGGSQDPGGGGGSGGGTSQSTDAVNADDFVRCLDSVVTYGDTHEFGEPRASGPHEGLDLMTPSGTPIYSPCDGYIRNISDGVPRDNNVGNGGSIVGNQLTIEPIDAFEKDAAGNPMNAVDGAIIRVILEHLDPGFSNMMGVEVGARVSKGQLIAYSDNTGNTNIGPHLHLGLRKSDGSYADPKTIMSECP